MSMGLAYWILMLIWLALGLWANWPVGGAPNMRTAGGHGLLFILLVLLGWKVFGAPIQT